MTLNRKYQDLYLERFNASQVERLGADQSYNMDTRNRLGETILPGLQKCALNSTTEIPFHTGGSLALESLVASTEYTLRHVVSEFACLASPLYENTHDHQAEAMIRGALELGLIKAKRGHTATNLAEQASHFSWMLLVNSVCCVLGRRTFYIYGLAWILMSSTRIFAQ